MKLSAVSFLGLVAAAFAVSPAAARQPGSDQKLAAKLRLAEAWLRAQLAHDGVPGASVGIVHDQKLVSAWGFGFANAKAKVPATARTRFPICSISKLFTSVAAMRERDAGRLSLDKPIADYLSWYTLKPADGAEEPVTARAIMSHAAGLPREVDVPYWRDLKFPDVGQMKARVASQAALYRPYEHHQYSNLGMSLLGEVVGSVSGQDYHSYVRRHLLEPLGLVRTTSDVPVEHWGKELAVGYTARKDGWKREPFPPYELKALAPAGGFASTVEDLARFAAWHFRLLSAGGEEVIKATTLREMQRIHWVVPDRPEERWGLGYQFYGETRAPDVGHGGHCPGYRSFLSMRPQDKLAVIVLTNVEDGSPARFVGELYRVLGPDILRVADGKSNAAPSPLTEYEGSYEFPGWDRDFFVVAAGDELLSIQPYAESVNRSLARYRMVAKDSFRRVRDDGSLAEEMRFERDPRGRTARLWWFSNYFTKK